ncbi:MAG: YybS family protein [Bacillota bacterium]
MILDLSSNRVKDFIILSAAFLIPALAAIYLPIISILAFLIIPVPLAILVRKLDTRYGLASLVMSFFILYLASGLQVAFSLVIQAGAMGILLGLLFKNHVPSGRAIVTTVAFAVFIAVAMLALVFLTTGSNPFVLDDLDRAVFDQVKNDAMALGGREGMDPARVRDMEMLVTQMEAIWPVIATSSIIIWVMVASFINYSLTRLAMARLGLTVPAAIPFSRWKLPWFVIWGVIAGLSFILMGDQAQTSGLKHAGQIILWVTGFVLTVLGASVAAFYFNKWKISWPVKAAFIAGLVILAHITVIALITLGLTDSIFNIRRLSSDGRKPEEDDVK